MDIQLRVVLLVGTSLVASALAACGGESVSSSAPPGAAGTGGEPGGNTTGGAAAEGNDNGGVAGGDGPNGDGGTANGGGLIGAGSGGTDAAAGSSGVPEECALPGCCEPLLFDAERSRLYLVNGQAAAYLVATVDSAAADMATFDVELAVGDGAPEVFTGTTRFSDAGIGNVEAAPIGSSGLTCGQSVAVGLRLRYAKYDPYGDELCPGTGFGPLVQWQAEVACPTCPGSIAYGDACDHPSISGCGYSTNGNPYCGPTTFLTCTCTTRWPEGERTWQCPVC